MFPYACENQRIAARNQLADFANRLGRRGTKIVRDDETSNAIWSWSATLDLKEQKTSGIRKIGALVDERTGSMTVQAELTEEHLNYIRANGPSCLKHGKVGEDGRVTYSVGADEDGIEKMKQDGINIPFEKGLTSTNRKKQRKINPATEALIQRLVNTGVVSERVARECHWYSFAPVTEAKATELLNDPQKWNKMANGVRKYFESMAAEEEALSKQDTQLLEGGGPTADPSSRSENQADGLASSSETKPVPARRVYPRVTMF
jgi:hypothetical protein